MEQEALDIKSAPEVGYPEPPPIKYKYYPCRECQGRGKLIRKKSASSHE